MTLKFRIANKMGILLSMKLLHLFPLAGLLILGCSQPNKKIPPTAKPEKPSLIADSSAIKSNISEVKGPTKGPEDITEPPFGLSKVKMLMAKMISIPDTAGTDDETRALSEKQYADLSFDEKFTYHMINPESYSQMCDMLPERTNLAKRIYGELPNIFFEYNWSNRQELFFKSNRDSVMALMKLLIKRDYSVGANFKAVMVMINAKEMIPFLTEVYNINKSDHYLLTVMMLLMKNNNYPVFMNSTSYTKLYASGDDYSSFLVYNKGNEDLIIHRATNFYHESASK
jgi:hypothetical protein